MMVQNTVDHDSFDVMKAIAAIGYLVQSTGASMYPVMKMMYLADKLHLEQFGRFIAGDHYSALQQGPVPCRTYDMVKCVRGSEELHAGDAVARDYFGYDTGHKLLLLKEPDLDELSESDIKCLRKIVNVYQGMGSWAVRDMAHDAAWERSWKARGTKQSIPMDTSLIALEFDDGEALADHLRDSTPGEAVIR